MKSDNLPKGWVWTRFDEVIEKVPLTDRKLKQSDYQQKGKFPVIDQGQEFIGGYTDNENFKICCESPVIIFGDHTKVFKYVNFDFVAGADGIKVIKPNKSFYPKLFYNFIQIIPLPDKGYARHFQFLEKSFIPLPPLPEQRAIVSKIEQLFSDLDNGIENFKKAQAQLKLYRQSVLKAACEGKLVPTDAEIARAEGRDYEAADVLLGRILKERREKWNGKSKFKEAEAPDTNELSELPEGWCWTIVKQVGAINEQAVLTGPFGSNLGREDFIDSGVPLLTIGCLTEQGLSLERAFYVSERKASELQRYRVKTGDILFSRMATVGRAGFVTAKFDGVLINYHLMRLRLAIEAVDPVYFISYVRGSQTVVNYIKEVNHGATRDGINTEQLLALPVALPPPSEQRRIVAEVERRLSVCDKMEATIVESLQKAESLRQSILKKAFEGKLLNKKELEKARNAPDWEPAEKLLERIKAEKARIGEKKRNR